MLPRRIKIETANKRRSRMDCRVKPGNDEIRASSSPNIPGLRFAPSGLHFTKLDGRTPC